MKSPPLLTLILVLCFVTSSAFAQRPASPSNGDANAISRTELVISWQDNSNNEDSFVIYDYEEALFSGSFPPFSQLLYQYQVGTNSTIGTGPAGVSGVNETIINGVRVQLIGGMKVRYAIYAYNSQSNLLSLGTLTPEVRTLRSAQSWTPGIPFPKFQLR